MQKTCLVPNIIVFSICMCLFIYLRSDEKNTILFREREKEKKKEKKKKREWQSGGPMGERERKKKKKSLALLIDSKISNLFTKISFNNFTWKLKTGMNEF